MHRLIVVVVACSVPFAAPPARQSDDDKERAELERLEKLEAELYKPDEVERLKKPIVELQKVLSKADKVELFRLNPKEAAEDDRKGKKLFHGYEIRTQVRVDDKDRRKEVIAFLGSTLHWDIGRIALCFNPRHGLRATVGNKTLDFVICFQCYRVMGYEGERAKYSFALGFVKSNNTIEQILTEAEKQEKKRK